MLIGSEGRDKNARHPSIVADAAFAMLDEEGASYRCALPLVLLSPNQEFQKLTKCERSGNFEIDEVVLRHLRGCASSSSLLLALVPRPQSLTLVPSLSLSPTLFFVPSPSPHRARRRRAPPLSLTTADLQRYSPTPDTPFSDLHEDLFIPQWVRDEVARLRGERDEEGGEGR